MKNISPSEWQELTLNNSEAVIIDVRTEGEYSSGKIPDAINMDIFETEDFIHKAEALDKSRHTSSIAEAGNAVPMPATF